MPRAAKSPATKPVEPANAFIGRTQPPTSEDLDTALGRPARALWDDLLKKLASEFGLETAEWNSYSPKAGWALRVKRAKRNIVYLSPCAGSIRITFILGEKAVAAAQLADLPKRFLKLIDEGPRYPEGRGVRFNLAAADIDPTLKLVKVKLAN